MVTLSKEFVPKAFESSAHSAPSNTPLYDNVNRINWLSVIRMLDNESDHGPAFEQAIQRDQTNIRVHQVPTRTFAADEVASVETKGEHTEVGIYPFGLLSLNGPLPAYWLECIEEQRQVSDSETTPIEAFINLLQERLFALHYGASMGVEPVVLRERQGKDLFTTMIHSMHGRCFSSDEATDSTGETPQFQSWNRHDWAPPTRVHLEAWLSEISDCEVSIEEGITTWERIPRAQRDGLGGMGRPIGGGVMLGDSVLSSTLCIKLHINCSHWAQAQQWQPESGKADCWMTRLYERLQGLLDIEVNVYLERQALPVGSLGQHMSLGQTAWIGMGQDNVCWRFSLLDYLQQRSSC